MDNGQQLPFSTFVVVVGYSNLINFWIWIDYYYSLLFMSVYERALSILLLGNFNGPAFFFSYQVVKIKKKIGFWVAPIFFLFLSSGAYRQHRGYIQHLRIQSSGVQSIQIIINDHVIFLFVVVVVFDKFISNFYQSVGRSVSYSVSQSVSRFNVFFFFFSL